MRTRILGALALGAVALAGCQGVPDGAIDAQAYTDATLEDPVLPVGPGGSLTVEAFEWGFDITEGVAIDGTVVIEFHNIGGATHNFRIDEAAGDTKKVEAPASESATGELQLFGPGEYTYYCDIPGHRAQGMEGQLVVYATEEEAQEAEGAGEGVNESEPPFEDGSEGEGEGAEGPVPPDETESPTDDSTDA